MISGYCRTNLDGFDCSGVDQFVAVPQKGEMVAVKYRGREAILEVARVTHKMRKVETVVGHTYGEPCIEVELTGRPRE